jgi:hypothetical protein
MERVSLGISYILLPTIGERLGEWFEILLRTARLCRLLPKGRKKEDKVDVTLQGRALQKKYFPNKIWFFIRFALSLQAV